LSLKGVKGMAETLGSVGSKDRCDSSNDVYSGVCSRLVRLCPRLVPAPLWGLSLATLSRLAPEAALAICDWCPEVVKRVHEYWFSLDRSGACTICGKPGSEVDENWLYCLTVEESSGFSGAKLYRGVAYLQGLRLLCRDCHLAKHQGYAATRGKEKEALEQLAKVNGLTLEEAKKLVRQAFQVHTYISSIRNWSIRVELLEGLSEELRASLENMLNIMYRRGFSVHKGWLYYSYPKYEEEVKPRIARETASILAEALRRIGSTRELFNSLPDKLLEVVKEKLEPRGVQVLDREFRMFMRYMLKDERWKEYLEEIVDYISKGEADNTQLPLDEIGLTGKWIAFVPPSLCPRVFHRVIELLEEARLAYKARIPARREDYRKRSCRMIVYAPVAIAAQHVADVAEILRKALKEFNVDRRLTYEPDIFTLKRESLSKL